MNNQIRARLALVGVLVCAALVSACATAPAITSLRQHPDFANAQRKVESVAVLPARVKYTRIVFTGDNERLPERERSISTSLAYELEQALRVRQYAVRELPDDEAGNSNQEIEFDLEQLDTAFNQAAIELYERPAKEEEAKQYRVNVGPIARKLADCFSVDALLISRYVGFEKSGGQKTKDIMSGVLLGALTGVMTVQASEGGMLEVALIDGTTGDVLWANRAGGAQFPGGQGRRGALGPGGAARTAISRLPSRELPITEAKGAAEAPPDATKSATPVSAEVK